MIFWILLFILVVVISYLLAYLSMRNFQEVPTSQTDYGLFLIRKTSNLTPTVLEDFHQQMVKENFIISIERLFRRGLIAQKGTESTLVIFVPRKLIQSYITSLDLLELEDYIDETAPKPNIFQMGVKQRRGLIAQKGASVADFFTHFPILNPDELVWWQLILQAKKDGAFEILPRVAFFATDQKRLAELGKSLQNLAGFLHKLPQPYTSEQMLKFYKNRVFAKGLHNLNLPKGEVLNLILLRG